MILMVRTFTSETAALLAPAAWASVAVALALAAGCRQKPPSDQADARSYPQGRCEVTVSGAVQKSFISPGGNAAVASVYWKTEQEMRRYFEWKAREGDDSELVAEEDVPLVVDQAMARNPRFTTLLLTCSSPDTIITLVPGLGSRYEQVPFRPAVYTISPAFRVVDAVPGTFAAQTMIRMQEKGRATKFTPIGFGELALTAFDEVHVAGTFAYEAQAGQQKIQVKGTFDFRKPALPAAPAPAQASK
jgi:hypothetical protein